MGRFNVCYPRHYSVQSPEGARLVSRTRRSAHVTQPLLINLHCLPMRARIHLLIRLMVHSGLGLYNIHHTKAMLVDYISHVTAYAPPPPPPRTYWQSSHGPIWRRQEIAVSHYVPRVWHALGADIKTSDSYQLFARRVLETYLFTAARLSKIIFLYGV